VERFNLSAAMRQCLGDCKEGDVPTVLSKKNHEEWLLTIPLKLLWLFLARMEDAHGDPDDA